MSTKNITTAFCYDALPPAIADNIRRTTDKLRSSISSTARLVVSMGLHLLRIRRQLKSHHGAWTAYVAAELPWSMSQAHRLMRAARAFRTVGAVDQFQPTALYVLTWPDAPPAATKRALEMARDGQLIDARTARDLVRQHRPTPPNSEPEIRQPVIIQPDNPERDGEIHWEAFVACLSRFSTLHIAKSNDEMGDVSFRVTAYPEAEGESLLHVTRDSMPAVMRFLLGKEPTAKRCRQCRERPVGMFCRNKDEPDGLNPICRDCERTRRQKAKRRRGESAKRARPRPVV